MRVSTSQLADLPEKRDFELVALDDALTSLSGLDPQKSQIVELRFFGGLPVEDIGTVLEISPRTVARQWAMAKAWLYGEIKRGEKLQAGALSGTTRAK